MWKAKRFNLPTKSSFFYNDLSPEVHEYLIGFVDKTTSGQPVLFFTKPTNEWTLVCSRQVICSDNEKVFRIDFKDIGKFKPTALEGVSKIHPDDIKAYKKSEWHQLTVVDRQSKYYILHADKGDDLFALWNILLMAVGLFRR